MGRMKNIALEIEEKESNGFMEFKLGISTEDLGKLTYKTHTIDSGLTRVVVFDLEKSPKELLDKIKNLENGNSVTYSLID